VTAAAIVRGAAAVSGIAVAVATHVTGVATGAVTGTVTGIATGTGTGIAPETMDTSTSVPNPSAAVTQDRRIGHATAAMNVTEVVVVAGMTGGIGETDDMTMRVTGIGHAVVVRQTIWSKK
jgi:hypothetical protein